MMEQIKSNPAAAIIVLLAVLLLIFLLWKLLHKKKSDAPGIPEEKKIHLSVSGKNPEETAAQILQGLGGKENLDSFLREGQRLKCTIRDYDAVKEPVLRAAGISGVLRPQKTQVHLILGSRCEELEKLLRELVYHGGVLPS